MCIIMILKKSRRSEKREKKGKDKKREYRRKGQTEKYLKLSKE